MSKAENKNGTITFRLSESNPINIGFYQVAKSLGDKYFSYWNGKHFVGLWGALPSADEFEYAKEGTYDHIVIDYITTWTGFAKKQRGNK